MDGTVHARVDAGYGIIEKFTGRKRSCPRNRRSAGRRVAVQQRDVGVGLRHWVMSIYAVVKDPRLRKRQARDVKRDSLNPLYRTKKGLSGFYDCFQGDTGCHWVF